MGPLPRSEAGHRCILVRYDYATRYPQAIALVLVLLPTTADKLMAQGQGPYHVLISSASKRRKGDLLSRHATRVFNVNMLRTFHVCTELGCGLYGKGRSGGRSG